MEPVCERCGRALKFAATGRPKRFCSSRCRTAACRARARGPEVPREVAAARRWVSWKPVRRGESWTKMPVQVNGSAASSTNAATWDTMSAVASSSRVGFVLGGGVGCIDLDHCLVDGVLTDGALDLLSRIPATWIEVSPSGDGLHVWGLIPEGKGRVSSHLGQSVEVYSQARFMTVTGRRFGSSPLVLADLSAVVSALF